MAKKKQMMLGEFEDKLKEHTVKKVLEEQDDECRESMSCWRFISNPRICVLTIK